MQSIIGFLDGIYSFFELLIDLLRNGFEVIDTVINLPGQAWSALFSISSYVPPYVWIPVMSFLAICGMLRIWSIITSGGN